VLGPLQTPLLVLLGILLTVVYFINHFRPRKVVELLRPRDSRGVRLRVAQETDLGLICKKRGGVVHRFIKRGRGWTFNEGGRMLTKFFGIEGTAYTGIARGDEIVNVSVPQYLKFLWGDKFYESIPEKQRQAVEQDIIGITVSIDKVDEEREGLPTLTADDINDEGDSVVLGKLAQAATKVDAKKTFTNNIIWLSLGALIMYFLVTRGII